MAWIIERIDETGEPVYADIPEYTPRRVTIKELTAQINALQDTKAALIEPARSELAEIGKAFHPYYEERRRIQEEIDNLKALRDKLRLI